MNVNILDNNFQNKSAILICRIQHSLSYWVVNLEIRREPHSKPLHSLLDLASYNQMCWGRCFDS